MQVWTSPLQRAQQTAAEAFPALTAVVHPSFIEVDYGSLDGLTMADLDPAVWSAMESDHHGPFGGGESLAQVDARVHAVLNELHEDTASLLHSPDEHLAIVSHVSPIKAALTWAMGVPGSAAWRMRIDNASLSIVGTRRDTPALVRLNQTGSVA